MIAKRTMGWLAAVLGAGLALLPTVAWTQEEKPAPKPDPVETQPVADEPVPAQPPTTTQEARQRALERLQEMRKQASSQPADAVRTPEEIRAEREQRREEARKRSEQLRKRALEARQKREAEMADKLDEQKQARDAESSVGAELPEVRERNRTRTPKAGTPPKSDPKADPKVVADPNDADDEAEPMGDPEAADDDQGGGDEPPAETTERRGRFADIPKGAGARKRAREAAAKAGDPPKRGSTSPGKRRSGDNERGNEDDDEPRSQAGEGERVLPLPLSPDGKTEWFSFFEMPWDEIVKLYAKRIGKPYMNIADVFIIGELTYETTRRFTKQEALDELNFLLVQQGYFLAETENYVYALPLNELGKYLPVETAFYPTLEAFEAAKLRDMEFASVLIRIKGRKAETIRDMIAPAMPDHALPVVLGDTNQIHITGLARDVRRFLELYQLYETEEFDPRETRFIKIKTNVREIERMLQDYFDITAAQRTYNRQTRKWETSGGSDNDIKMIPDERTKTLIVKASTAKLTEIEDFIALIDQDPGFEFDTHVIEVKHGSAVDIANLLNQIFQQEQGTQQRTPTRTPTRTTSRTRTPTRTNTAQNNQAAPEQIIVEDLYERAKKTVRLVADERTNKLIVYANKDGLERVNEMLAKIDLPVPVNFKTFYLDFADADQIQPLVEQFVRGTSTTTTIRGRSTASRSGLTIIADPVLNALHVSGEPEEMGKAEEIIGKLDNELVAETQHVVQLTNLTPSRVAQMVSPLLTGGGASPTRGSTRRGARPRANATPELIPLDEAGILIVICSDSQWEKVEDTIRIWDESALSNQPRDAFFQLENTSPEAIVEVLNQLYRQYSHPILGRSAVLIQALQDDQIIVHGVQPAIDEIEALLPQLDVVPKENPLVILPLEYADAAQVAELAESLLPSGARASGRRGRPAPGGSTASITPEPVTNSLIIRADDITLDRIKRFASEMEQAVAQQQPERRFYSLKNAASREVATLVTQLFGAASSRGRGRGAVGTQVKVAAVGTQVVIDAPAIKQAEIGAVIQELDERSDKGITTKLIKLPGAPVRSIAQKLTAAFRDRVRTQDAVATFLDDSTTETILLTCSADVLSEAEELINEFQSIGDKLVWGVEFFNLKHANADEAARWVQEQLVAQMGQSLGTAVARQIRVTGDSRTNRVAINAPETARMAGAALLENYDMEGQKQPESPIEVWTTPLAGVDIRNIATQLKPALDNLTRNRPDRLRATVSGDQVTSTLVLSAPKDVRAKVEEIVGNFTSQADELKGERRFIQLKEAEAGYVAQQLNTVLVRQIERQRGRGVSDQVSIVPEQRLNQVIISAPKFAVEMAEELIKQLDQAPTAESQLHTLALEKADSRALVGVLNTIFREKIRAKTITLSAEPLTNSIIVGGSQEEFESISQWVRELEQNAEGASSEIVTIDLEYADPWETRNMINDIFGRSKRQGGAASEDVYVTVSNSTLVVKAPGSKLEEVKALIATIDNPGTDDYEIKTYDLKQIDANQLAGKINNFLRNSTGVQKRGTMRPEAFPEPLTNTLVVIASKRQIPMIDRLIESVVTREPVGTVATIDIKFADPYEVRQMINDIFRARRGSSPADEVSTTVSNNTLVVKAPTAKLPEIRDLVAKIDVEGNTDDLQIKTYDLKRLDAQQVSWQVSMFLQNMGGNTKKGQMKPAAFAEPKTNTLVVIAPADKLPLIESLIAGIETKEMPVSEARPYTLTNVRADQISRNVEQMLKAKVAEQEGARAQTIQTAVMEAGANQLVVFAPDEYQDMVGELLKMIDSDHDSGEVVEIVRLEQARAGDVARAVADLQRQGLSRGQTAKVAVVADDSSNSVILRGLPTDIADLQQQITALETNSANVPELKQFQVRYVSPYDVQDTLAALFPPTNNPMDTVTVTVDEYYDKVRVTANRRKMRQVETYIAALDVEPDEDEGPAKEIHFVDIYRGDPFDIAWDVQDLYPADRGPSINADLFGDYIKVVCRPGEFDGILKNIRMFEARAKVERKLKETRLAGDPAKTIRALMLMHPELRVEYSEAGADAEPTTMVETLRKEGDLPESIRKRREEKKKRNEDGEEIGYAPRDQPTVALASYTEPTIRERVDTLVRATYAINVGAGGQDAVDLGAPQKDPVGIKVFDDGRVLISGPKEDVEEIESSIDIIESDLGAGEVIRIFQFTYGDVTQAARILDLMFNEPQQVVRAPQRQQPNQQQQQQGRRGQEGDDKGDGRGQGGGNDLAAQLQSMIGAQQRGGTDGKASTRLRIATDVGNNYLIVKCDEARLPEIRDLLIELDIPPGEVEIRVYQLKSIDATEAAENIKAVLGIGKAAGRQAQRTPAGRGNAQQQILELLEQTQVSVGGGEGAKVDTVEIVPNAVTNALLVSSPPEVLPIIEDMINELESLSGYEIVVIEEYPLQAAKVDDVLPLLQEIFAAAASGGGGGGGRRAAGSPAQLGTVTVAADSRRNVLIYTARQKDVELVERQIALLDVEGALAEAEIYVCQYGDASSIATAVSQIFLIGGGGGQRGNRGGGDGVNEMRLSAEPSTNTILVYGPAEKRELVFAKVRELDRQASTEIRELDIKFAKATKVADSLLAIYGGATPAAGGGRRGARSVSSTPGRLLIYGDDGASKLLVRAPQPLFEQIEQTTKTLDQPPELLKIRKFELRYADPMAVKASLDGAIVEYAQRFMQTQGGDLDFDAFTTIPDSRTNSLVVVGSDQTFLFVEQALDTIDIAPNEESEATVRLVRLPLGMDAAQIAAEVSQILNDGEMRAAERENRVPNLMTIGANTYSNALTVFGSKAQYDVVNNLVTQLQDVRGGDEMVTRVVQLQRLTSDEAREIIERLQQQRSNTSGGTGTIRRTSGSPTPSSIQPGGSRTIRPSGNNNRSQNNRGNRGRRPGGSLQWERFNHWDREARPAGSIFTVSSTTLVPALQRTLLASAMQEADQPAEQPAQPAPPARPAVQPVDLPQNDPAGMLDSVSGQLRSDVYATPLDSQRIVITGDERDIAFIEQMLMLMEATAPEGIIEIFSLQNAKASAIQPIVEQTIQAFVSSRTDAPGRADRFSVIAENRSNSLFVTASEKNMEMIRQIVQTIDAQTDDGGTDFRSFQLSNIRAQQAKELLDPVVQKLNAQREVPADQQSSLEAIAPSNSLLAIGTPRDLQEIEKMIVAIDQAVDAENDFTTSRVLVMDLRNAAATELAETLTQLIALEAAGGQGGTSRLIRQLRLTTANGQELPPLELDKPIEIIPEPAKNSLIILSSPKNNEALKAIVGLFDQLPDGQDIEIKTMPLQYAAAERVAETLQTLFDEGKEKVLTRPAESTRGNDAMPPQPRTITGNSLPYNVVVKSDVRTNSVIVVGRTDAIRLAGALVSEMDQPSVGERWPARVVSLRNLQATELQERLTEMLDKRAEALGEPENLARDNAILMTDERSNSLVVIASNEVFGLIEGLALQLDETTSYRVVDSRFRRLEYADSVKLGNTLQEFFDKKKDAINTVNEGQNDELFVLSDSRSNSLLLTGTRDFLAEAEQMVNQLDRSYVPTLDFKVRPVLLNSAAGIATRLQEMIDATRDQGDGMEGTPIHISADPYSNTLLLAASREDMIMVERWVEVLDRPSEPGRVTKIFPLSRGDAEAISTSAGELFQSANEGNANDVTVTHDPTTNSVVVSGPPQVVRDVEDFLARIDTTEPVDNGSIQIFKLDQADAETAGNLLRSIVALESGTIDSGGLRSGGGSNSADAASQIMLVWHQKADLGTATLKAMRSGITVIDNVRTNQLIVIAPTSSMPLIESLVAAIDVPPDAAKIRIFPLRNSDAQQMVEMLDELFATSQTGTGGGGGTETERILQLEGFASGGRQELSFTTDMRTNSVIAAGTTGYLDLVEELILKLDTQDIQSRTTFVYTPHNNDATAIQTALQSWNDAEQQIMSEYADELSISERMSREIVAVASEDVNRMILNLDPRRQSEVLSIVKDLDQPPPQVMIQVLIAEVTLTNSLELGVEFAFQDLQFTKAGPGDTNTFDFVGGTDLGAAGAGLGGFTFTISGQDFNFLLRTLQNEGTLNVLQRPQIMAMDNLEARIEITNDVPYVSGTQTSTTGQISTAVARQDVGIILEVTPRINPDGFVNMHVRQEVSDLTDSTVDVGQGVTAPIFFRREAETDVTVRNNETVVLGGLISTTERTVEQKIPGLGDIPVVGLLFRNNEVSSDQTELLVVLTPRVVRTVEDYRELSIRERDLTGKIPDSVLTNPLMQGLQVRPEDLRPVQDEGLLEPINIEARRPEPQVVPIREAAPAPRDTPTRPSYDIPVSRNRGGSGNGQQR